jgi:F-type H+-transporting ATPase subunit delta
MTLHLQGLESRYSKALYMLATEAKSVDKVYDELQMLGEACEGPLGDMLVDGSLKHKVKAQVLADVSKKAKTSDMVQKFVQVVALNGRADALPRIIKAYAALRAANNAEVTATVFSAQALTPAQEKKIVEFVKSTDKAIKSVDLKNKVDSRLMAGMKVRIGSTEYDASLRGALTDLRTAMKG